MATLSYAKRAIEDLDRLATSSEERGATFGEVIELVRDAVSVLARHPLIGRLAEHSLRELVISRGKSGYIALYDYDPERDRVVILTIRAQREAGYRS